MEYRSLVVGVTLALIGSGMPLDAVEAADRPGSGVSAVPRETNVTREYYTQLHASIDLHPLPTEGKAARKAFEAILGALGGRSDSRSVTVGVRVSIGDVHFPEYPLASYEFDSKSKRLSVYDNRGHDFPLKRLDSNEKIVVDVIYRDTTQVQYKLDKVTQAVGTMVPGSALLSLVSKPFIQQVAQMGGDVLASLGSSETNKTSHFELSPYANNTKHAVLPLVAQGAEPFATVRLALKATPSLLRTGRDVYAANQKDLEALAEEDFASLELNVGGVRKTYLSEVRGLSAFNEMTRDRTPASRKAFCMASRDWLGTQHGLTMMDRSALTLLAMEDAGFKDRDGDTTWFHDCFNSAEKQALKIAHKIDLPLPTTSSAAPIAAQELYAFGCWMLSTTGPECARKATDAEATLASALADNIRYHIDSSFLDTTAWGEEEAVTKKELISALKGTASGFSCFKRGMLVTTHAGQLFRLEGELLQNKIVYLVIRPVSEEALQCTV